MFRQRPVMTFLLLSVLSVCFISARAADRQIEAPISGREIQYGNYSTYSAAPEARAVFTAPSVAATAPASAPSHDDPVFASRNPTHPYNPPQHHQSSEGGYGGGKPKTDSRSLSVDKSPPELQFGLSFTVPFISLSTDRLLSAVTGKSSDYSDAASLLKLNVGGLVVAAVVGIAALFFVPSLFPGKFASLLGGGGGGYGFMPNIMEHFFPGFNKPLGYGQYDTNPFPDPYSPDYNNQNHYKHAEGYDSRGRAIRGRSANETDFFSQVRRTMVSYLGNMEGCATQVMCLQGKRALEEEKLKKKEENEVTGGGKGTRRGRKIGEAEEGLLSLSNLEHVLEAAKGIKRITKQAPIVLELRNAFTAGKNGADCIKQYKSCPVTSDRFANTIQNVGNYIFNS